MIAQKFSINFYKNFFKFSQRSFVFLKNVNLYNGEKKNNKIFKHDKLNFVEISKNFHLSKVLNDETVQFKLADIGEGIKEVVIKEWYVKIGDTVNQFDNICEVQSDKASVTITSRFDGKITKLCYEVDDIAKVGDPIVEIQTNSGTSIDKVDDQDVSLEKEINLKPSSTNENLKSSFNKGRLLTTPAVRKLAIDYNIDLNNVQSTGKDGRILKEDLLKFLELKKNETSTKTSTSNDNNTQMTYSNKNDSDKVIPIKGIQKAMFKTMTESLSIPHFGLSDEIDITNLMQLREVLKKHSQKLTYMPFFVKAASLSLSKFPILNSCLDAQNQNLILKKSHNIGIAIDTPHGLVVANIKNVNLLSIAEISEEMVRLQELANKNQLSTNDLNETTFTLSNIGSIGGVFGIPVIAHPQVSIGAIGKIKKVPKFDENDNLKKAYVMNVVWTADHRVIDGATMARFNINWKDFVENPSLMLTYLK